MEIIADSYDFIIERRTAVAIGKFDGVHIGHRRLLEEILAKKRDGLLACVFTFDPPPAVLFGASDGRELTNREEKRRLFEQMGVDILVEFPLTYQSAAIRPEDFVENVLVGQMNAGFVAAGKDLSFGDKGAGDAQLLQKMASDLGYEVSLIEKISVDGVEVSSTVIRSFVEQGKMQMAERFLGMPYSIFGEVVHGRALGRTLGFPTINMIPAETKLLPPYGVYTSRVRVGSAEYAGVSNIGIKPTVGGISAPGIETYLYDFSGDLYGAQAEVFLLEWKRPETKFASPEELKAQVMRDMENSRPVR